MSAVLEAWSKICGGYPAVFGKLCHGQDGVYFSIAPERVNIYCGAAYNIPFELGMFGGGQYFRFRNLGENKEKWCGFFSNFNMQQPQVEIPVSECRTGECVLTSKGYIWSVKRYTDDLIVLQGCGMDEYTYRRDSGKEEAFIF